MAVLSVLTADGDLSIAFLFGLWVLGVAASVPLIHKFARDEDGVLDAERVTRWAIMALAWPFMGIMAAVLLPILAALLILALLTRASPALIFVLAPIIELPSMISPRLQAWLNERLDNLNTRIFAIHEGRSRREF